mgnify:FL=1
MKLIMENWKKFLKEEETPEGFTDEEWAQSEEARLQVLAQDDEEDDAAEIRWSKSNQAPSGLRGDIYSAEDEQLIQQALGPDYYVVEYQYDASGEAGMEAQDRSREYFDKYVSRPARGPGGETVVMPQKTLADQAGHRVHYFKIAHNEDRDAAGNMYAQLVT